MAHRLPLRSLTTVLAAGAAVTLSRPILQLDDGHRRPLSTVFRAYLVYSLCSIPPLVDYSPRILNTLGKIPGIASLTEAFVHRTFYSQFVGGPTAHDTLPLLRQLRMENKGILFAYSVEDDEDSSGTGEGASTYKRRVEETIRCIDVAADFEDASSAGPSAWGRKTWVAVKLSALVPSAEPLRTLSTYLDATRPPLQVPYPGHARASDLAVLDRRTITPGLSAEDVKILRDLRDDLVRICTHAQKRGVRVIVDAEYTWWQPAIDAYTHALMRQFNRDVGVRPLVYGTFQAYLRRTHAQLTHALADARAEGYSLGVKLVRGAYHPHELARHTSRGALGPPPVWERIEDTDAQYLACTHLLLGAVAADVKNSSPASWMCAFTLKDPTPLIGVLFGTHNTASCSAIVKGLLAHNLASPADTPSSALDLSIPGARIDARVAERVAVGQLYGMCDHLTDALADAVRAPAPFVIKYVPYGALSEVMPYLARRAIENKSVLNGRGGAGEERQRAAQELRERVWGAKHKSETT